MKTMTAAVRTENGDTMTITSEYATKKDFRDDLSANGYTVIGAIMVDGEESPRDRGETYRQDRIAKKIESRLK